MSNAFFDSTVVDASLSWMEASDWRTDHGQDITPDMRSADRHDSGKVVLAQRLRDTLASLNPGLPSEAQGDAFFKLTRPEGANLIQPETILAKVAQHFSEEITRLTDGESS